MSSRFIKLVVRLSFLSVLLAAAAGARGQTPELRVGEVNEFLLDRANYTANLTLEAGDFARLDFANFFDQPLAVYRPDGTKLVENDYFRVGIRGSVCLIAPESGVYRVEIRFRFRGAKPQKTTLTLAARRPATEADRDCVAMLDLRREAQGLENRKGADNLKAALDRSEQALALARRLGDRTAEAEILIQQGELNNTLKRGSGIELMMQALTIFEQLDDPERVANAYFYIGNAYLGQLRLPESEQNLRKCVETAERLPNPGPAAPCLINIGVIHMTYLGEVPESEPFARRAVEIFRINGAYGELVGLRNLIVAYTSMGDVKRTLETYAELTEASARFRLPPDCNSIVTIGLLQYNLQNWELAGELFKNGRTVCQNEKSAENAALALVGQGAVLVGAGETDQARPILTAALDESRAIKSKLAEALALGALGLYYDTTGDYPKAVESLEASQTIFRTLREPSLLMLLQTALGKTYLSVGEIDKAEAVFNEMLTSGRRIEQTRRQSAALFGLAEIESRRGNLDAARTRIEESLKIIEDSHGAVPTDALRVAFFASVANYYEFYTDLLMRLDAQRPGAGFDKLALAAAERARARSLLNQLQESGTDVRGGVAPDLLEKEKKLRQELNAQNSVLLKMMTSFTLPGQLEKARAELRRLNAEYDETEAQIAVTSPAFAALTQPAPLSFDEIRKQLDPDTLLLEFALGEEKSYLFALTPESLRTYELPKKTEIEAKVWNFRRLLTVREQTAAAAEIRAADDKLKTATADLSDTLFGRAGAEFGGRRLAIVANGALQFVPFAALRKSKDEPRYLIETNELTVLPSVSVLAVQRGVLSKRKPAEKTLAVFADPVYETDDPRFQKVKTAVKPVDGAATRGEGGPEFLDERRENGPQKLQRLLYSRREANQILALVADNSKKFAALDFAASLDAATAEKLRDFRYLHFATHGVFNAETPQSSGVVLSLYDDRRAPQNGLLSLQEIYNLRLNSELVVLSACRTGLGRQVRGEGVIGLTRGFMYAGSRRVAASLWKVQDDATAELMTEFYRSVLRDGRSPAAAMRLAQLAMLKKTQFGAPFYWAAFVHYGEWR
ncbi:MAG: CHAT domain-containing protein [Acidobacteria bacterium]|nr:CHAT domain-containing protein [Acidobacteriota bacterium]